MKAKDVELQLIAKDAIFFRSLGERLINDENGGSLIFSLVPYLSLFTWESAKYVTASYLNGSQPLKREFGEQIRSSRHRIKLFEKPDELIALVSWARRYHRELFIEKHTGILAPLVRAVQPDLGIYTYDRDYYGSSLLALVNLGFDMDSFPQAVDIDTSEKGLFHDFGLLIGSYTSEIIAILGLNQWRYDFNVDKPHAALFDYVDKKASPFFDNSFNGNEDADLNSVLFIIYLSISFIVNVFDEFIIGKPEPYIKIKYITLYHVVESLQKVQNMYRPRGTLSQLSMDCLAEILSDKEVKLLTKDKNFRNTLVHYGIDLNIQGKLDATLPFCGLIEHYFPQGSFEEFNHSVDINLWKMFEVMHRWLPGRMNA